MDALDAALTPGQRIGTAIGIIDCLVAAIDKTRPLLAADVSHWDATMFDVAVDRARKFLAGDPLGQSLRQHSPGVAP